MSGRKVLLLEPNYKNKYPPMGLMKLAMYYRLQGDDVVFWKGEFNDFIVEELTRDYLAQCEGVCQTLGLTSGPGSLMNKLMAETPAIKDFIRTGKIVPDSNLDQLAMSMVWLHGWLQEYRKRFKTKWYLDHPRWDIVCVTTLFTFYWDITIKTIEFAKKICKDWSHNVQIGGILASVVPGRVKEVTGIAPHCGVLNVTHFHGDPVLKKPFDKTVIDALPLDYSILDEVDYQYPETDAFYGYATRGCVNHCSFCVVPLLEPEYKDFIPLRERIAYTTKEFGEQRNLLLLDNNVFASARFNEIIDDIREQGFGRGNKYVRPNQLEIAVRQLKKKWNVRAYLRRAVRLLSEYRDWIEKNEAKESFDRLYSLLADNGLLHDYTATRVGVLAVYKIIGPAYAEWHKRKTHPIVRIVDFNQGLDARLVTPEKMKKLSEIAIRPMRIAFDNWELRDKYVRAIRLGAENGIVNLSNYLLYNFTDKPRDLYCRLRLNIDLCDELGVNIYSFPMKYHPIKDEAYFSNRDFIGDGWNRKFIRAIQSILNSTHGKIGRGRTFFFKAFGRNEEEFEELLWMPESFIIKRWDAEIGGLKAKWQKARQALSNEERKTAEKIVEDNVFVKEKIEKQSPKLSKFLSFYLIGMKDIPAVDEDKKRKRIAQFESSCSDGVTSLCRDLLALR